MSSPTLGCQECSSTSRYQAERYRLAASFLVVEPYTSSKLCLSLVPEMSRLQILPEGLLCSFPDCQA